MAMESSNVEAEALMDAGVKWSSIHKALSLLQLAGTQHTQPSVSTTIISWQIT